MRCIKLTALLAIPLAFALTLGAAAPPAEAGRACRAAGLPNNCVRSSDVRGLTKRDIRDEAGAELSAVVGSVALAGPDEIVNSVTINAPAAGVVIANASGYLRFDTGGSVRCGLSPNATSTGGGGAVTSSHATNERDAWGLTNAFVVPRGPVTVNLVCTENSGQATMFNSRVTAMYFPTRY